MTRLLSVHSKRFVCPNCGKRGESGIKLADLLMLRCRGCGFRVTVPLSSQSEVAGLRPRDDIEWHAAILYVCPSRECDATFVIGRQPSDGHCPECLTEQLERVEYVPRRFVTALEEERQAALHCINLYGDETLHSALDAIGWVPRA
jgi:DNA-directed RNA polymerase subunit RPC12/RpoP